VDGTQVNEAKAEVVVDPTRLPEPPKWKTAVQLMFLAPAFTPFWLGVIVGDWFEERYGGDNAEHEQMTPWVIGWVIGFYALTLTVIGALGWASYVRFAP